MTALHFSLLFVRKSFKPSFWAFLNWTLFPSQMEISVRYLSFFFSQRQKWNTYSRFYIQQLPPLNSIPFAFPCGISAVKVLQSVGKQLNASSAGEGLRLILWDSFSGESVLRFPRRQLLLSNNHAAYQITRNKLCQHERRKMLSQGKRIHNMHVCME